jgi:serine/threonine protein kinase/tetratricopeptide (TPR) repeat protein
VTDPARWNRIQHIVAEAARLAGSERSRFLSRSCGRDAGLRREVDSLLLGFTDADPLLSDLAARAGLPFAAGDDAPPPGLERVGAYRLLRCIGSGGMGAVYLADRVDGEFEMRVAIKLLPTGIHTESMRRRFAAERQILARLAHPGIGRLLDGGVTSGGVPYLVMEYASGVPIDVHCDDGRLDIDRRLSLFLEVCEAVEYAHSHSVVHRDLKPSNILVSADGCMKLLDFGIAKVLDGAAPHDATTTGWGSSPMTLNYASPEQITGERIGYASDIYQLGVLLYLLLTGRLPADTIEGASWQELARATAGRRVIPASTAVGMPGQKQGGATGSGPGDRARMRRSGVAALRSRLAGSLDAIVFKALRNEPARRYTSVAAFAGELRRHLSGRPVAAELEAALRPKRLKRLESAPAAAAAPAVPAGTSCVPVRHDLVAVLPFGCPPAGTLAYLRHGLVPLLAAALDESGLLSAVEPVAVLAAWPPADAADPGSVDGRRIAELLGAALYIVGEVVEDAGGVRISAALHDAAGDGRDRPPRAIAVASGRTDEIFELVDQLAIDILTAIAPPYASDLVATVAAAGSPLAVFKYFLRGEQALDAGAFFAAAEAYQRAVEADPDFALGYYRLALAAYWGHNLGLTRRFAAEAAARSERLPPRERRLLAALEEYLGGDTAAAEASYAALLEDSPGDLEAAFLAGTLLFFHNPLRGRRSAEARPFFERVLAIRPNHILSLLYLSTIVARSGDLPALDALTQRLLAAYPDGGLPAYPLVARAQRAFAAGDTPEQDRIIDELRHAGTLAALTGMQVVVLPFAGLNGAGRMVELLLTGSADDASVRATGHVMRAHIELGGGRIRAAARQLDLAEALGAIQAREFRVLFALAPFLPAAPDELRALGEAMRDWDVADPPDAPPPIPHFAPHRGVHADLQNFLLGLVDVRLGADDAALERATRLDAAASSSDDIAPRSFAVAIRAGLAHVRSGPAAALAIWEAHELGTSVERALSSSIYAHGHARFTRAILLRAAGRSAEALAWLRTFGDMCAQDSIYLAPAHLQQAEILLERGDAARAVPHYRHFLELWKECDTVLQPVLDSARDALAGLTEQQADPPPANRRSRTARTSATE